ncbi:spermidine/putrescine ABC transporter ATP-binding protein [Levilactobacillus bambusae]|uniref:Spermidine/putrescine ABC transporter ATP-binding protein n=2 Tax=Levilactobacillus bambusae TaxID=2024736 RepID=A0A2V1N028_9LACO|nr:spermidine/putrescine ABC transporter ATP-binding protein [Levilactobacillus bambusae]
MSLIDLENVGFQADGQTILKDISFSVEEQEIVTITGASGSGKSTLVRILSTLQSRTSGTITYKGKSIDDYDPIQYRREVSYCFQQPSLFGDTVKDNLQFPYDIRNQAFDVKRAQEALTAVDLNSNYLDKAITELSGGERQRVAMLRNVMFYPQVLIMDEVTAGLDEDNKQIIHKMMTRFNQNDHITLIIITHDQDEMDHAKRLITIENGQLKGDERRE